MEKSIYKTIQQCCTPYIFIFYKNSTDSIVVSYSRTQPLSLSQLLGLFGGRRLPWCGCHAAGVWLRRAHTLSVGGEEVNHYAGRVCVWWRPLCCSQLHLYNAVTVSHQFCHIHISIALHCVIFVLCVTLKVSRFFVDFDTGFISRSTRFKQVEIIAKLLIILMAKWYICELRLWGSELFQLYLLQTF